MITLASRLYPMHPKLSARGGLHRLVSQHSEGTRRCLPGAMMWCGHGSRAMITLLHQGMQECSVEGWMGLRRFGREMRRYIWFCCCTCVSLHSSFLFPNPITSPRPPHPQCRIGRRSSCLCMETKSVCARRSPVPSLVGRKPCPLFFFHLEDLGTFFYFI